MRRAAVASRAAVLRRVEASIGSLMSADVDSPQAMVAFRTAS
jgi:hypothetical protein